MYFHVLILTLECVHIVHNNLKLKLFHAKTVEAAYIPEREGERQWWGKRKLGKGEAELLLFIQNHPGPRKLHTSSTTEFGNMYFETQSADKKQC